MQKDWITSELSWRIWVRIAMQYQLPMRKKLHNAGKEVHVTLEEHTVLHDKLGTGALLNSPKHLKCSTNNMISTATKIRS